MTAESRCLKSDPVHSLLDDMDDMHNSVYLLTIRYSNYLCNIRIYHHLANIELQILANNTVTFSPSRATHISPWRFYALDASPTAESALVKFYDLLKTDLLPVRIFHNGRICVVFEDLKSES